MLEIKAEKYGEIYQTLLEYERTSGFPDALIDRKNILAFYNRLRISGRQNDQHIDRMMTAAWGKDWQRKLLPKKTAKHMELRTGT